MLSLYVVRSSPQAVALLRHDRLPILLVLIFTAIWGSAACSSACRPIDRLILGVLAIVLGTR
jgi:hypothetical protein